MEYQGAVDSLLERLKMVLEVKNQYFKESYFRDAYFLRMTQGVKGIVSSPEEFFAEQALIQEAITMIEKLANKNKQD